MGPRPSAISGTRGTFTNVYKKYRWRAKTYERSRFSRPEKRSRRRLVAAAAAGLAALIAAAFFLAGGFSPGPEATDAAPDAAGYAPEPAAPDPAAAPTVTLAAVGDVLLSRKIESTITEEGWKAPFKNALRILAGADLSFCNLETPAALSGEPFPGKDPDVTFRAPPEALFGLKSGGFSVVSLANNHINDYGPEALAETLEALDLLGIERCGAGLNAEEAGRPAIVEAGGLRFAFLAYAEAMWSVIEAGEGPGVVILDRDRIAADVRAAGTSADLVVVSLHWGEEHQGKPRDSDRELARAVVDAGADLIIGHHPHVLQGAEFYRGSLILYSLGNFIFDMISARTYESAAALVAFDREGPTEVAFRPILIDRETYAPDLAAGKDAERIGALIRERCAAVGGRVAVREDGALVLRNPDR
jgi:poly-gamma-glutamate synthesis protein (capsule biosynthesis protein)